jgi:hypothetical protein
MAISSVPNPWNLVSASSLGVNSASTSSFNLDIDLLKQQLKAAPLESTAQAQAAPLEIQLPNPNGTFSRYAVVETMCMAPELAAKYPDIKTYQGVSLADPTATITFDTNPSGFYAQVLTSSGSHVISNQAGNTYTVGIDQSNPGICDCSLCNPNGTSQSSGSPAQKTIFLNPDSNSAPILNTVDFIDPASLIVRQGNPNPIANRGDIGGQLRTYDLAVAATGEYTALFGNNVANTLAAITRTVNSLNAFYEKEVSVRMRLVANNDRLIYTNPANDPYTNSDANTMLGENQANIDTVIDSSNYDIGHVFGVGSSTSANGVAFVGVVGNSTYKAQGASRVFSSASGAESAGIIRLIAHEFGHQFGASHSFNADVGTRSSAAPYEPGSGTTLMSYAGILGSNNIQANNELIFNFGSLNQITDILTSNPANAAATITSTGNSIPTVNAGLDYTIPARTPFMLTATGSDPNGDPLTYSWEEFDLGPAQNLPLTDNGQSPIFRNFLPTTSPTRYFPRLPDILDNNNVPRIISGGAAPGELLPTTTRTLNFVVTARDNRTGGGAFSTDRAVLNVIDTGASFQVTAPDTAVSWTGNSNQTVTWNVAGTNANGINAANVDILLSIDGGNTFPTVLLANTPNDGSQVVSVPNLSTIQARIMVKGSGNVFFDVSNTNFTITPSGASQATLAFTSPNFSGIEGNSGTSVNQTIATIQRIGNSTGIVTVPVNLLSTGTATSGTDFTNTFPIAVSFADGETSKNVQLGIIGDTVNEPNETINLQLGTPTGNAILGVQTTSTFTILNDDTNDFFDSRILLSGNSATATGSNAIATGETGEPDHASNSTPLNSIWWEWVAPSNGSVTINTTGSNFDTTLGVYTGTSVNALTPIASNDDVSGTDSTSTVTFNAIANTSYKIAVDGFQSATGNVSLSLTLTPAVTPPSITLAVSPSSVTEDGATNLIYTFTRSGSTTNALNGINFSVGGTATLTTDYSQIGAASFNSSNGTINFAAGSATANLTIDPLADTTVEPDETIVLTLASGTGYTVGTISAITATILNDDVLPTISIAATDANAAEQNRDPGVFTITRTGATSSSLTVNYAIGGTATNSTDYDNLTGSLTIPIGQSSATVTVTPIDDNLIEQTETVLLNLSNSANYTIGSPNNATVSIVDNDVAIPGTLSFLAASSSGNEGNSGAAVNQVIATVQRTGGSNGAISVPIQLATNPGSATAGTDYTNNFPITVNFGDGDSTNKTVSLPIIGDTIFEPNETINLLLGTPTGGASLGTQTTSTFTILNDDLAPTGLNLDIDGNGIVDALTDGILTIRYLFGLTGTSLTNGAVGVGATRTSGTDIINYLTPARSSMLDVDGNGNPDALTDGILMIRYMFGLTDNSLVNGAIGVGATRTTGAAVQSSLQSYQLPGANSLLASSSSILG